MCSSSSVVGRRWSAKKRNICDIAISDSGALRQSSATRRYDEEEDK